MTMERLERLVAMLREIEEDTPESDGRVIGGVAVHLRTRELTLMEEERLGYALELLPVTDPLYLATRLRVTEDLDLAVRREESGSLHTALKSRGFIESSSMRPPPTRYIATDRIVDLIIADGVEAASGYPALHRYRSHRGPHRA